MPDIRQATDLFSLRRHELVRFMASASADFAALAGADVRLAVSTEGATVHLPHFGEAPRLSETVWKERREALIRAYVDATGSTRNVRGRTPVSVDLAPMHGIADAALLTLRLAAEATDDLRAESAATDLLTLVFGDGAVAAEVIRRGRNVRIAAADGRAQDAETLAFLRLSDASDSGATLDGLTARTPPGLWHLAPNETSGGTIFLPRGLGFGERAQDVGRILAGLAPLLNLADADLLLFGGLETGVLCCLLARTTEFVPAEVAIPDALPGTPISLARLDARPGADALAALADRIAARGFPTGYRVALQPLPDRYRPDSDVEILREEIDEREAEIAMIEALSAPQMRLLRFSDAQLPALVDAIRRLPPRLRLSEHLRYASAHAAGRAEPAHYVLYDPARVAIESVLPEFYWRDRSGDDHPIAYWLDPFAARGMQGETGEPLVFVPVRSYIEPPIDSFGAGIDGTLRLILGNLFADAQAVREGMTGQGIFLFTPTDTGAFVMELELLDVAAFAPLHMRIRWINDHLLVRSPRIADPAALKKLADDLYEGEAARDLSSLAAADKAALEAAWTESAEAVRNQVTDLVETLVTESLQTAERLALSLDFIDAARRRVREVDQVLVTFSKALDNAETELARLTAQVSQDASGAFVRDLVAEFARGRSIIDAAQLRIEARRQRLDDLVDKVHRG